jgi:hypothetical protein
VRHQRLAWEVVVVAGLPEDPFQVEAEEKEARNRTSSVVLEGAQVVGHL